MKTLRTLCAAVLVAVSLPVALTACAPSETRRTAGEVVDDASITTRVKAALAADEVAKAHQVDVDTREGVVQLSGFVESQRVADRAVEVARKVSGVKSVKNDMRLRSSK